MSESDAGILDHRRRKLKSDLLSAAPLAAGLAVYVGMYTWGYGIGESFIHALLATLVVLTVASMVMIHDL